MKVLPVSNSVVNRTYSPNSKGGCQKKGLVSPSAVMIGGIISAVAVHKIARPTQKICSEYVKSLAAGVTEMTGKKVNPLSLSCVMDKSEFVWINSFKYLYFNRNAI